MKVVVGAIFGIIQFVLGIVIFVAGVITGGIIVDSSYEVSRKEAKKKKQFSKIPSESFNSVILDNDYFAESASSFADCTLAFIVFIFS